MASWSNKPGINLFDTAFYFDVVGGDDGANYGYDPVTDEFTSFPAISTMKSLQLDKVSVKRSRSTVDHSPANSFYEHHRIIKSTFTIQVDTKLQMQDGSSPTFIGELTTGSKIVFAGIDTAGTSSFYGVGIIESFDIGYGSPTTLSFSIKSYGARFAR